MKVLEGIMRRMPATEFYFKESTNQWSLSMEGCVSRMAFRIQISPFLSFLEQLLFPACFSQLQLPPLTAHNGMFSSFSGLCYLFVTTVWYSEEGNALPDPERTDARESLHTHTFTLGVSSIMPVSMLGDGIPALQSLQSSMRFRHTHRQDMYAARKKMNRAL